MKMLSWQLETVLVISVFISVFTWQWSNNLWLQYFSLSPCLKVQNCLYDSQSGISFPYSNSTCSFVFAWFGNVHCWSMSSLLCFHNHKIVCCVLDMMLSFSITEMHLCVLWTKAGFWSFLFSSVDLYITDHNKSKYVTVHEFMILIFNSGTVKVELTASVAALQFYYCSLHYLQYIWVQQSLG